MFLPAGIFVQKSYWMLCWVNRQLIGNSFMITLLVGISAKCWEIKYIFQYLYFWQSNSGDDDFFLIHKFEHLKRMRGLWIKDKLLQDLVQRGFGMQPNTSSHSKSLRARARWVGWLVVGWSINQVREGCKKSALGKRRQTSKNKLNNKCKISCLRYKTILFHKKTNQKLVSIIFFLCYGSHVLRLPSLSDEKRKYTLWWTFHKCHFPEN